MKIRGVFLGCLLLVLLVSFVSAHHCDTEIQHLPLKVSLVQGGQAERNISHASEFGGDVEIESNVPGLNFSQTRVFLDKEEIKQFTAFFDARNLEPGVYVGKILFKNAREVDFIQPVVFEVESKDVFFDANLDIPPLYTEVNPGDKVVAQVKIFDLISENESHTLGATKVNLNYKVYNLDGTTISSEDETITIDKRTETTISLNIPDQLDCNEYVIATTVSYKSSIGVASKFFTVSLPDTFLDRSIKDSDHALFLVIIIILSVVIIFLVIFFIFFSKNKKVKYVVKKTKERFFIP